MNCGAEIGLDPRPEYPVDSVPGVGEDLIDAPCLESLQQITRYGLAHRIPPGSFDDGYRTVHAGGVPLTLRGIYPATIQTIGVPRFRYGRLRRTFGSQPWRSGEWPLLLHGRHSKIAPPWIPSRRFRRKSCVTMPCWPTVSGEHSSALKGTWPGSVRRGGDSDAVFSTLIGGAGCYALTPVRALHLGRLLFSSIVDLEFSMGDHRRHHRESPKPSCFLRILTWLPFCAGFASTRGQVRSMLSSTYAPASEPKPCGKPVGRAMGPGRVTPALSASVGRALREPTAAAPAR